MEKQTIRQKYTQKHIINSFLKNNMEKTLDKYEYNANKYGTEIKDYDKYHRAYRENTMLIITAVMLYLILGVLIGISIALGG